MGRQQRGHRWTRWARRAAPIFGTLAVHAFLVWLALHQQPRPRVRFSAPVAIWVLEPPRPRTPEPPVQTVERLRPPPSLPPVRESVPTPRFRPPAKKEEPPPPSTLPEKEASSKVGSAPRAIDLFPKAVLERYQGDSGSPGGAAAGGPESGGTESAAQRAQRNVAGWLADDAARKRVEKGQVAPVWHEIERNLKREFSPPPLLVRRTNRVGQLAVQILGSPFRVKPEDPQPGASPPQMYVPDFFESHGYRGPSGQVIAPEAFESPTFWRRTEVELRVDGEGTILSVRVVRSSGKLALDDLAVEAVRKAASRIGPLTEPGPVTTLWAVESTVVVTPPDRMGFSFDESGTMNSGKRGLGKYFANGRYPLKETVQTRVSLFALYGAGQHPSDSRVTP